MGRQEPQPAMSRERILKVGKLEQICRRKEDLGEEFSAAMVLRHGCSQNS